MSDEVSLTMPIDTIIFDYCGTLVDEIPRADADNMYASMAATLGMPAAAFHRLWRETGMRRRTGGFATETEALREVARLGGVSGDGADEAARIHLSVAQTHYVPRPDALAVLTALRDMGRRLGLISNCGPIVPQIWRRSELAPLFDVALFSCEARCCKPDPRIFEMTATALNTTAENCVYVGDGGSGELTAAKSLGMGVVCIRAPHEEPPDDLRADAREWTGTTIASLGQLMTVPGFFS